MSISTDAQNTMNYCEECVATCHDKVKTHTFLAIEIKDTKVAEMLEKEFRVLLLNRINNHIGDSEAEG